MARPKKATVDYFPHNTTHGKTMFILEGRYKNDGYAVFFKILELLGKSDNHFLNSNDVATWEFITAYCHVQGDLLREILDLLAAVDAIDKEFWADGFIYSQNFVDGVKEAYRQRKVVSPDRLLVSTVINTYKTMVSTVINLQNESVSGVSPAINLQMKVNEMKVNEMKVETPPFMSLFQIREMFREKVGQELGGGVNQELSEICKTYTPEAVRFAILSTSTRSPIPRNPFMYFKKVLEGQTSPQTGEVYDSNKEYSPESFYFALQQAEKGASI